MITRPTRLLSCLVAALFATTAANAQQSGLTSETWNNLTKTTSITTLQKEGISTRPADSTAIIGAQVTGVLSAGKGMRLRGSITPTQSDTYTFWISGADNVALWISDDTSRFKKKLVAYNLSSTNVAEWDKSANQKSTPIALVAGQTYYIEAQVMDYDGGGHIGIAWRGQKGRYGWATNGAVATQSTTKWGASASRATDGNTSGVWALSEPTLTENQPNSWLQVTFAQNQAVNQVVVYNASANQNYLSNFRISVLDQNDAVLATDTFFTTTGSVGNSMTWNLPATVQNARKVKIQLLGNNLAGNGTLSIAELEAYGAGLVQGQVDFREVIPSAYLSSIQADPSDTNDNNLSDAWESQTGLTNSTLPGAHSEFGDPDNDGLLNYQEQQLGTNPLAKEALLDGVTRLMWMGINGSAISNATTSKSFYGLPSSVVHVPGINDTIIETNYASRYRGAIIAPTTGNYRFYICGNGSAELWLADGTVKPPGATQGLTNRFGKRRIAYTNSTSTPQNNFDYTSSQRSGQIYLVQGQTYYIEALHKAQNASSHYVSVAWEMPGQSRSIMPQSVFQSDVPVNNDADNDNLPDTWETAVGLSLTDNGYTDLKQGEFGDYTGGGLTNLQKYQYGLNPKSTDTDGDGISDYDEIYLYGTNPLVSNNLAPVTVTMPAVNQYSTATGAWSLDASGHLCAQERRGDITYTFTVTQAGVHEVVAAVAAILPAAWTTQPMPLTFRLDNDANPFSSQIIYCKNSLASNMRALTPWLSAGTHKLTIHHENYDASRRLRIDSVTIKRLGGQDLDQDGIPDWIQASAAAANALTRVPLQSRTSPTSIEGITSQLSSTSLNILPPGSQTPTALTIKQSVNTTFYADVPLSTTGSVTLTASFQNGVVTDAKSMSWIATNLFDSFSGNTLHIRKGDSLRLDAWSGQSADGQPFTVTSNGTLLEEGNQVTTHTSGQPFVATFNTAGTYTLVANHGGQQKTVTLQVHGADFGAEHIVLAYLARTWTPTTLDSTAKVEADDRIIFTETTLNMQTGPRTFSVKSESAISRYVIARLPENRDGAPSAILARGAVHSFDVGTSGNSNDAQVVTQYADGTWLMRTTFVAVNLPPNVMVRITINNQGTLFANGSNTMELHASDFDANGIAQLYFEWSGTGALPKICHNVAYFIEP